MDTHTETSNQSMQKKAPETVTMPKPNSLFNVPCSSSIDFFKRWCVFLRPFISLTDKEVTVIASLLKQRWELSKSISDASILDTMTMSDDTKKKVIEECHITSEHFYVIKSSLKKKGVIVDDMIIPEMIPKIREEDIGTFRLLIQFKRTDLNGVQ